MRGPCSAGTNVGMAWRVQVCEGVDWVYMLAADMGGMGFIQSNHSRILYNNTMISFNMVEAARQHKVPCSLPPCRSIYLLSYRPI